MLDGVSTLRAARDVDDFLVDPLHAYVLRRTFCFWQVAGANGVLAWGAPNVDDVAEMCRVFDVSVVRPEVGRHVSIVDTTGIRGIDALAFDALLTHLTSRREAWANLVERQAVIVLRGVFGAALAGVFQLLQPRYPTQSFTDPDEAIAWALPREPEATRAAYRSMRALALELPDIVRRIRGLFDAERRSLDVDATARRLGLTPRTLQRQLRAAQTSMRQEARAFRLRRSASLLARSDLPILQVARAVGVSEAQLGKLYRSEHGLSPNAFRQRTKSR